MRWPEDDGDDEELTRFFLPTCLYIEITSVR